ncbi:MAG: MerR family transcriptional regulator [Calditrichaeota bacterium]|nr:MerR family transcriptional regulator [Calditrichota bacterium]
MEPVYMIGDLASMTGLSIHTINYYINLGLVEAAARANRSGYRLFDNETLNTLKHVIELRCQKIPIREIVARKKNGIL